MKNQSRNTAEIRGALYGTLLGDSTISNRNEFSCEQISENLIQYKGSILSQISKDMNIYYHSRNRGTKQMIHNKEYNRKVTYVVQTNRHAYFKYIRKLFYHTGTKQVTMSILNHLTAEGLALWFMDDGYLYYDSSNHTRSLKICTDSFDPLSIKNIIQYFNDTWNIQCKVYMHNSGHKKTSSKPRISFNPKNAQKFISIIYKYFLPEFYYKIDLHYSKKTLHSVRCSSEYFKAVEYMLQHTPSKEDDIV